MNRRAATVILLIGAVTMFTACQGQQAPNTTSATAPTPATTAAAPQAAAKSDSDPVQVRLPQAAPIPALVDDYTRTNSIWVLVNKTRPLTELQYAPANLVVPNLPAKPGKSTEERSVRADIVPDLTRMFAAAKAQDIPLEIDSAYRSYALQTQIYAYYVRQLGEAAANQTSAKPGQSEHQTGLAVDIGSTDGKCSIDPCFAKTAAGKWLVAHSTEYGFILRYPSGSESVTGYEYEPWHFRYVGVALATAIHQSGLATYEAVWPYLEQARTELRARGAI